MRLYAKKKTDTRPSVSVLTTARLDLLSDVLWRLWKRGAITREGSGRARRDSLAFRRLCNIDKEHAGFAEIARIWFVDNLHFGDLCW